MGSKDMKKLLHKEFCFTALPLTYLFLLFAFMTWIPGYPILVGAFFACLGIFQSFLSAREQNDLLYTVLMPISKTDAVKARYLFAICIEMIYVILCTVLTVFRMTVWKDVPAYVNNPMMNADPAYLGYILLLFAAFNGIFIRGYWKTAYALGRPFLISGIVIFLLVGIAETLHHLPGMTFLNSSTEGQGMQYLILDGSLLLYAAVSYLSMKASCRDFEKIDL
jgi:hypothetical protein